MRGGARACPYCGGDSRVIWTKDDGQKTVRRRECLDEACRRLYKTAEVAVEPVLVRHRHTD